MKDQIRIEAGYATSFLQIGLGSINFHGAMIQADSFNLFVSSPIFGSRHMIQAIKADNCVAHIPVHSRSLRIVRLIWADLAKRSTRFTYAFPESEREWLASL